jgi:chloramphenicol O-acetyltransferase type A
MKEKIDIERWSRKEHFLFFSKFEEPFFGLTFNVDCTDAYHRAKRENVSFFLFYLFRALVAANSIENFRYRIVDKEVYRFDVTHASATISRPDGTFGFSYIDYEEDEPSFYEAASLEIARVKQGQGLQAAVSGEPYLHVSAIPWISFTSISHARSFSFPDSSPKISFGKVLEEKGRIVMPVSVHAHHGLMDAIHVGQFAELFQLKLYDPGR